MAKAKLSTGQITESIIIEKVHLVRGLKVMLDKDLAEMYGVETFRLNEAVKRNLSRFPLDFMFQLTKDENDSLISQIAISKNPGKGGTRKLPYAFTEQGVAMLSSVLNSDTAIQVNIQIIRVFTKMKQLLLDNKELFIKIDKLEREMTRHDEDSKNIFIIFKKLVQDPNPVKEIQLVSPIQIKNKIIYE